MEQISLPSRNFSPSRALSRIAAEVPAGLCGSMRALARCTAMLEARDARVTKCMMPCFYAEISLSKCVVVLLMATVMGIKAWRGCRDFPLRARPI